MGNLGTLKATNYNDFPREFRTNQTFKILHLVPQEAQSEGDARDQGEQGQAAPHRPALPLLGGAGVAATGAKVDQEHDQGRDQPGNRRARGLIRVLGKTLQYFKHKKGLTGKTKKVDMTKQTKNPLTA